MKLRYLSAAALALGVLAAQPALAQSMSHDTPPKSTTTHKKSSHKKKKTPASAPAAAPADTTKTQ